jgi:hypothetical protein
MLMNLKKWFAAALLATAFVAPASAVVPTNKLFDAGDLTDNSFSKLVYHLPTSGSPAPYFKDTFEFFLSAQSTFNTLLATVRLGNFFGINHLSVELYSPTNSLLGIGSMNVAGILKAVDLGPLTLAATNELSPYRLLISGKTNTMLGGGYLIGLQGVSLAAAPVPEPAEWLMLVVGLMIVAFIARRRRAPASATALG